jgi:hypothetical protein
LDEEATYVGEEARKCLDEEASFDVWCFRLQDKEKYF